jgi:Fe(3+) dicitrate transport protein
MNVMTGGVGFSYDSNENLNIFGGVYAGASLPGPRSYVKSHRPGKAELEEETSTSFELGARYEQEAFAVTGAVFYTVLEDFIVPDNYGTGFEEWPTDPLTGKPDKPSKQDNNDGEITSLGLELQAAYDFGIANGADYSLPVHVGITLTNAEFDGNASSADGESIFSGSHDGNEVPYVPDFLLHAGIGYAKGNLRLALDGSYVSESNASGWNNSDSYDPTGDYNAQYGKIDSYFVADLSAHYALTENTTVFATARNVFDEEYVVGRLPQGARPGMPQQLLIGVESQF